MSARRAIAVAVVLALHAGGGWAAESPAALLDAAGANTAAAAAAQRTIDQIADETDAMTREYETVLQRTRALDAYVTQLEALVATRRDELAARRAAADQAADVRQALLPLLDRMAGALHDFVTLDLPFLVEERRARVAQVRALLARGDVSLADKYRRLIEAFRAEAEYGRTLGAERTTVRLGEAPARTVDLLRVGRLALFYRTLDGASCGRWEPRARRWEPAPAACAAIAHGLAIARERAQPAFLELPVPAPRSGE